MLASITTFISSFVSDVDVAAIADVVSTVIKYGINGISVAAGDV